MPTNDFEKKVQEEMTGFGLRPSDDVWLIVEERIRERKRRRFLFWLLPLMLGGGIALYILADRDGSLTHKDNTPDEHRAVSKGSIYHESADKMESAKPAQLSKNKKQENQLLSQTPRTRQSLSFVQRTKKKIAEDKPIPWSEPSILNQEDPASISQALTLSESSPGSRNPVDPAEAYRVGTAPLGADISALKNPFPAMSQIATALQGKLVDPVAPRPNDIPRWSISIKAGNGNITDPILGGSGEKLYSGNLNSPGTGSGVGNNSYISEARPSPAFSYGIMFNRQYPIGRKHSLMTGLGFSHYANHRQVGAFRDSLAAPTFSSSDQSNGFYRGGSAQSYTSRYDLLEWPIGVLWRLGKGKQLPVELETGILYGRVIHSKGLVYGGYGYFEDRDYLRKNQWQFNLGLGTRFFSRSKHPLGLGLRFQSGLNSFYKPRVADPKALHFIGLNLSRSL